MGRLSGSGLGGRCSGLTDHAQVDFGVAGLADAELDAAPVDAGVLLVDVGDRELGGLLVLDEEGPVREDLLVRAPLREAQVPLARVHAANKVKGFVSRLLLKRFLSLIFRS